MNSSTLQMEGPAVGSLRRLSAWMCGVAAVGGVLAVSTLAWVWLSPSNVDAMIVQRLPLAVGPSALDLGSRLAGFAISMIPMAALLYMLHQAFVLFNAFRVGHVLPADAPIRLRRIGQGMLALAVLRPLATALVGLVLTWSAPPGQRILSISVSIDDYMIAAFGGLVLAIGYVMAEAKRISDENREIV